jgi:Arc/MetJ-type ribon-helix-helix transcriptional regulator
MMLNSNRSMDLKKPRATITIEQKYLDWLDEKIAEKRFANRSHGIEYALQMLMNAEKNP